MNIKNLKNNEYFSSRGLRLWLSFKSTGGLPVLFLLLICLPLADQVFKFVQPYPLYEKRKLAEKPRLTFRESLTFLKKYDAYFNDHFPFRNLLIYHNNLIQTKVFHTSPVSKTLIGKDGWLFLAKETETRNEVDYFRSLRLFTPGELKHWRLILRQRREWLRRRGIAYIFMVVPNKSTIYPEYMPSHIRRLHSQSRLDQLLISLRQEPNFPVIDLREGLLAAKKTFRVYNKTDSHWNELGAYFAYLEIIKKLSLTFPDIKVASLGQFTVESSIRTGGDLARLISQQKKDFREQVIRVRPKSPVHFETVPSARKLGPNIRVTITQCSGGTLPTTLMIHDSFVQQLKPFIAPHFRRIVFIWDWGLHFFKGMIETEKPKIVIEEMTERSLCDLVPENPPEMADPEED